MEYLIEEVTVENFLLKEGIFLSYIKPNNVLMVRYMKEIEAPTIYEFEDEFQEELEDDVVLEIEIDILYEEGDTEIEHPEDESIKVTITQDHKDLVKETLGL